MNLAGANAVGANMLADQINQAQAAQPEGAQAADVSSVQDKVSEAILNIVFTLVIRHIQ